MKIGSFLKKISWPFKAKEKMHRNEDQLLLELDGLKIFLQRDSSYDTPHEVSVIIPRAEFRKRIWKGKDWAEEYEIILNSITVVHSPIRPPIGGSDRKGAPDRSGAPK